MKQAQRILLAVVLVLTCFVVYQQKQDLGLLEHRVSCIAGTVERNVINLREIENELDLSVLDSCGIITDGHSLGSCVAIGPNLILTAGHCVDIPNSWIEINGVRLEIKSKWRSKKYDVGFAVVDVDLPCLKLDDDPNILDEVYIVGTPYNKNFLNKISKGVVCKINLYYCDPVVNWNGDFVCDAMAWKGNSGGPVLKKCGRIAGIYIGLFPNADNFSICVPVSQIKEALEYYYATVEGN